MRAYRQIEIHWYKTSVTKWSCSSDHHGVTLTVMAGPGPKLLVLQHIACEPPAAYEDEMLAWGVALDRVMVDRAGPLHDWGRYAGIVAMGGPMGAYEDDRFPWLVAERRLIADAVRAGTPYWGVCLGAQLLAASLGARVFPGRAGPEVGVLPVFATPDAGTDPVGAKLPSSFRALQWHGDTFELPEGAVWLARSAAYEQQAFVINRAYGLQFHLEVDAALGTEWGAVPAYADSLRATLGADALAPLISELRDHEADSVGLARELFGTWLEHVVGLPRRQAA
jgi:GMP synthase-like glutamine amidotransferase